MAGKSAGGESLSLTLILLCLAFAASIAVGQVLFKLAGNAVREAGGSFFVGVISSPAVWLAFAWYGASSFLWIYILGRASLSSAYPYALFGSALVPILSWAIFRERISLSYVVGMLIVLAGLYIIFGIPTGFGRSQS